MARRLIASLLLIGYLPACSTWRIERGISPASLIADQRPETVRVTRLDSSRIVLQQPRIDPGDTISAMRFGLPARIALSDITQVETKKSNGGATVATVFLVSIGAVAIMVTAFKGMWGSAGACYMGCN